MTVMRGGGETRRVALAGTALVVQCSAATVSSLGGEANRQTALNPGVETTEPHCSSGSATRETGCFSY